MPPDDTQGTTLTPAGSPPASIETPGIPSQPAVSSYVMVNGIQVPLTEYKVNIEGVGEVPLSCLLYTSPSPRD